MNNQQPGQALGSPEFRSVVGSLEALLLDLGLGGGNGRSGVGVDKAAARLAGLVGGGDGGADANIRVAGTAGGLAVGIADAPAGDKLLAVALADVLGTGVVGRDGEGRSGD